MKSKAISIRLSQSDCKVLSAAQGDFRLSTKELSKITNTRHYTIGYSLRRLKEQGIIKPYILTNIHVLGLTDYCIFFNYIGEERNARQKIIKFCMKSNKVAYFAELMGTYQFSVSLFCKTVFEVTKFFEDMRRELPKSSFDISFALRLDFTQFIGKHFSQSGKFKKLSRTKSDNYFEIDLIDRKILAFYSQNAHLPLKEVAKHANISETTVRYRLKELEKKGIIIAYPYFFDSIKAGMITFRTLIATNGLIDSLHKKIFSFAEKHPKCTTFVRCVGAWDFELNFDVENPSLIGPIVEEVHDSFPSDIRHLHTLTEISMHRGHHFPEAAGIDD